MRMIKQIRINGDTATIFYINERYVRPNKHDVTRRITTQTKIISLDKLAAKGALDIDLLEEELL